jgi:hypothetical protein
MPTMLVSLTITLCLAAAIALGLRARRWLPEQHLTGDTKDTVKVAVGLIATMSALLLGLLVGAAKDSYDTVRKEVVQMAAQTVFLDRVLTLYGAEAAPARAALHAAVEVVVRDIWHPVDEGSDVHRGDGVFLAIQGLAPQDDMHKALKDRAVGLAVGLGEMRTLLHTQSQQSVSRALLVMVVFWLVMIFFGFSLLAPANPTATGALLISALSVAGALFLILEMDRPFTGLIRLSEEPMTRVLHQMNATGK